MVSDSEIISAVLEAIARVQRGEASIQLAGGECLEYLLRRGRSQDAPTGVVHGFVPAYDAHPLNLPSTADGS